MGLFGGFKAKFTKDSTAKNSESTKKNEVVCLGYRVYSEFDNPPQYTQNIPETRKPPAPRTVPPRQITPINNEAANAPKPSTSTPIKTQIVTNPKIKKSSKKKAPVTGENPLLSARDKLSSTTNSYEDLSNLRQENEATNSKDTREPIKLLNGVVKDRPKSDSSSVYIRGKTSSFNPNNYDTPINDNSDHSAEIYEAPTTDTANDRPQVTPRDIKTKKAPKSILKTKSYDPHLVNGQELNITSNPDNSVKLTLDQNIYSETDYDKTISLSSTKTGKSNEYTTKTTDYMSATESATKNSTTQVSTYVHTEVSSTTTGTTTNNNEYAYQSRSYSSNESTRSIGNTSNFAASIFFGGDEEPEVQRPRRANLAVLQSEEERRSSAEC